MWGRVCVLLVALCALAAAAPGPPAAKRAESEFMSPMPFVLGSRYGRSQQRLIAPRNDRFFMGSRYGKRSDARLVSAPPLPPPAPPALLCEPTALYQLYRCSARTVPDTSRRLDDERETSQTSEEE